MFNEIEMAKILKGNSYILNEKIKIRNPKLGEVVDFGESDYSKSVKLWDAKPSEFIVELDDQGIDFTTIDNYDLFLLFFQDESIRRLLYWWIEDSEYEFKIYLNQKTNLHLLYDIKNEVIIDKHIYNRISEFVRVVNLMDNEPLYKPRSEAVKKYTIQKLREDKEGSTLTKNDDDKKMDGLSKYINALSWNENSSVNIFEIWNITLYQLYSAIKQIGNVYQFNQYVMMSSSGNFDMAKSKKNINWF